MNCFRYLDFNSLDQVDRLTLHEYELLMKGARLRKIDEEYAIHLLAWKSFQAQGVKNNRKPVYDNFSKFYDYETRINEVLGTKKQKNDDSQDPVSRYKDFLLKKESVKNGN